MEINRIVCNFKLDFIELPELQASDYLLLIILKSPMISSAENAEPCKSLIIYDCKSFNPNPSHKQLTCDFASFKLSNDESCYFKSINIPIGIPINLNDDITISELFMFMQSEFYRRTKFSLEFAKQALKLILIKICDLSTKQDEPDTPNLPRFKALSELRENIYKNPFDKWNVDEICEDFGVGRTYFHRIYFSAFGTSFMQDVINCRLNVAKDLLINTDLSVNAISEQCGYESDSYFMRQFKSHTTLTPSAFRKKFRNK